MDVGTSPSNPNQRRPPALRTATMKKLLMTVALVALTATFAQAQENVVREAEARAEADHERIVQSLGLNQDQTTKIKEINANYHVKVNELQAARESGSDVSGKRAELEKARLVRYKAVLTPEQYATLESKLKEMNSERKAKVQQAPVAE